VFVRYHAILLHHFNRYWIQTAARMICRRLAPWAAAES
jgi:hypothetical protein